MSSVLAFSFWNSGWEEIRGYCYSVTVYSWAHAQPLEEAFMGFVLERQGLVGGTSEPHKQVRCMGQRACSTPFLIQPFLHFGGESPKERGRRAPIWDYWGRLLKYYAKINNFTSEPMSFKVDRICLGHIYWIWNLEESCELSISFESSYCKTLTPLVPLFLRTIDFNSSKVHLIDNLEFS